MGKSVSTFKAWNESYSDVWSQPAQSVQYDLHLEPTCYILEKKVWMVGVYKVRVQTFIYKLAQAYPPPPSGVGVYACASL